MTTRSRLVPWGVAAAALLVCAYSYLDRPARFEPATVTSSTVSRRPTERTESRRAREADERPQSKWRPTIRRVERDDDVRERGESPTVDEPPVDESTRRRNEAAVAAAHTFTDRMIDRGEFSRADVREVAALVARVPADDRAAILQKLGRAINGDQIAHVAAQDGEPPRMD
ncbi:MAG TPA: hypothetical protein VG755_43905 [Nannocystaceae bacterium]|nr:hypothetical protein [Nannocystaceae bacterium]